MIISKTPADAICRAAIIDQGRLCALARMRCGAVERTACQRQHDQDPRRQGNLTSSRSGQTAAGGEQPGPRRGKPAGVLRRWANSQSSKS